MLVEFCLIDLQCFLHELQLMTVVLKFVLLFQYDVQCSACLDMLVQAFDVTCLDICSACNQR